MPATTDRYALADHSSLMEVRHIPSSSRYIAPQLMFTGLSQATGLTFSESRASAVIIRKRNRGLKYETSRSAQNKRNRWDSWQFPFMYVFTSVKSR
jgi:hypothetical protein